MFRLIGAVLACLLLAMPARAVVFDVQGYFDRPFADLTTEEVFTGSLAYTYFGAFVSGPITYYGGSLTGVLVSSEGHRFEVAAYSTDLAIEESASYMPLLSVLSGGGWTAIGGAQWWTSPVLTGAGRVEDQLAQGRFVLPIIQSEYLWALPWDWATVPDLTWEELDTYPYICELNFISTTWELAPVPEPGTLLLLEAGLLGLASWRRRQG